MRYFITIAVAACLLGNPSASFSSELFGKLGLETRYTSGETSYHINFDEPWSQGGHGESKLEFPIDSVMAGINVVWGNRYKKNRQQTQTRFSLTWLGVVHDGGGIMKDSDWVENDAAYGETPHEGRDLYTESDAELKGTVVDANFSYNFRLSNSWTLGPLVGYRYHDFKYDIYGYRGIYWTTPVSGEGKVLEYKVTYNIPYVGLSSDLLFGKRNQFRFHFILGYSDWADAEDRDDHLLRNKLSEGDCEGEAWLSSLTAEWAVSPRWRLSLGGEYADIDTKGIQHQSWYAGSSTGTTFDVDQEISSTFWSVLVKICFFHDNKPKAASKLF